MATARAPTAAAGPDQQMDVWLIDVGQGSCVVVDCPDRDRPLVVDCGTTAWSGRHNGNADLDRQQTMEGLSARLAGLGRPTIVISHGDADHYALIPDLVEANASGEVWIGGARSEYGATNSAFQQWARDVESAGRSVSTLPAHFFGPADPDLHCGAAISDILIANAQPGGDSKNANSVVLALSYAKVTIVLAGDAEGDTTEAQALDNRATIERLASTRAIVVGSHHGARTFNSNSERWASEWSPYATIFSQKPSSYGHPTCDVVRRYAAHMDNEVATHRVPCGRGSTASTETRILSTSGRGDILLRIRPTRDGNGRIDIFCQVPNAACSGPIPDVPVS